MKQLIAICGIVAIGLSASTTMARVEQGGSTPSNTDFETAPLVHWDEPDIMAQQQPVPPAPSATQPPAAGSPVTPPATTTPPAPPALTTPPVPPSANSPRPEPEAPAATEDAPAAPDTAPQEPDAGGEDDFSLGDIPIVETVELKSDTARKALDAYIMVREKYKDAELENFENLQDFVDQTPQGKAFEADIKAAGFANVIEWNTIVTTLSFAYDNSIDDQTADIRQQIGELQGDTEMAQDMRDRMIAALNAMIPSENNKKVLEELKADPIYAEKLKLLESETE